jgi:2'-5' RNA ligase
MRLFFALPLPGQVQDALASFQSQAKAAGATASWPDPRGLHVTLAFLGEVEEARVPGMLAIARHVAGQHTTFPLQTSRLGGFPKDHAARVLWLGLEAQLALPPLVETLRLDLRAAGANFDDKPFRAHLTLARFKVPRDLARFPGLPPLPMAFEAQELVLYQSVQTSSTTRYVPLGTAPLRPT